MFVCLGGGCSHICLLHINIHELYVFKYCLQVLSKNKPLLQHHVTLFKQPLFYLYHGVRLRQRVHTVGYRSRLAQGHLTIQTILINYESMVSLVSRRYMRGENGTESLVV